MNKKLKQKPAKKSAQKNTQVTFDLETATELDLTTLLLELLEKSNRPLQLDSILRMVSLPRRYKKEIEATLYDLQKDFKVVRAKGAWVSARLLKSAEGTFAQQKSGFGLVQGLNGQSIVISTANMADALHGDTVKVIIFPGKRAGNFEGRVVEVTNRALEQLTVKAEKTLPDGVWACTALNPHIHALFTVNIKNIKEKVTPGMILLVKPELFMGPQLWLAKAIEVVNQEVTAKAQEQLAKYNNGVPGLFPAQALAEAEGLPNAPEAMLTELIKNGRKDLRHIDFVTIDGETAKDFDDAIFVEKLDATKPTDAGYRLYVAIADVAHYVTQGSALDIEALQRGNSYYFPFSVEPMLPEKISNGLCSLVPHAPRLVMVATITFSTTGAIQKTEFYEGIIESKARLTYTLFYEGIEENKAEALATLGVHERMLRQAKELALLLQKKRTQRGSLEFSLPEPVVLFDDNENITDIIAMHSHFGHKLIEEFMLCANESVALFLQQKHIPLLYRTHPAPAEEKLENLMVFLERLHTFTSIRALYGKKDKKHMHAPSPLELQSIIAETATSPLAQTIHRVILRAMMQAKYSPKAEGHYGLASECYCHFTSPIRRYADLTIHRALKKALNRSSNPYYTEQDLTHIAEHINATERVAVVAEREVHKRLSIVFLQDKIGKVFQGVVSGVTDFGLFVELTPLPVEGLVAISSMDDDYYKLVAERQELQGVRTGNTYTLGQPVTVVLKSVNITQLHIDVSLQKSDKAQASNKKRGKGVADSGANYGTSSDANVGENSGKHTNKRADGVARTSKKHVKRYGADRVNDQPKKKGKKTKPVGPAKQRERPAKRNQNS